MRFWKRTADWPCWPMPWPAFGVLVIVALLLLVTGVASGQAGTDQLKLKTGGGAVGDSVNALTVAPYEGASGPSSPVTGQLWCDTNYTPCTQKRWDGAAWQLTQANISFPVQTDSTFPVSPSAGQIFYDTTSKQAWIYNDALGLWCLWGGGTCTSVNITDTFTGTGITNPTVGSMASADNATGGNMGVGTHSFKMTCANTTGGETLPTAATASVTFTASHSYDLSNIPTCSGGPTTTARRIYASKGGAAVTGPWYWIKTIADNSTTSLTAQAGLSDANLVLLAPKSNYSAALDARWVVTNTTASTDSGGCGSTGSALACYSSNSVGGGTNVTTDSTVRVATSLGSYNSGDYTIQYRIKFVSVTADTADGSVGNPMIGGMRIGSADSGIFFAAFPGVAIIGGTTCTTSNSNGTWNGSTWTSPLAASNNFLTGWATRVTAAAGYTVNGATCNCNTFCQPAFAPFPLIGTSAWVKWVKSGTKVAGFTSSNGRDWTIFTLSKTAATTQPSFWDATTNNPTQWELDIMNGTTTGSRYYIEIDNWTLTVN